MLIRESNSAAVTFLTAPLSVVTSDVVTNKLFELFAVKLVTPSITFANEVVS